MWLNNNDQALSAVSQQATTPVDSTLVVRVQRTGDGARHPVYNIFAWARSCGAAGPV